MICALRKYTPTFYSVAVTLWLALYQDYDALLKARKKNRRPILFDAPENVTNSKKAMGELMYRLQQRMTLNLKQPINGGIQRPIPYLLFVIWLLAISEAFFDKLLDFFLHGVN